MDRAAAFEALPLPYGAALLLAHDGADDVTIAAAVGVPADAVAALLEIGEAKLAALLELLDDPPEPDAGA